MLYTSSEIKAIFGYSQKTALIDAKRAWRNIEPVSRGMWRIKEMNKEDLTKAHNVTDSCAVFVEDSKPKGVPCTLCGYIGEGFVCSRCASKDEPEKGVETCFGV